MPTRSDYRPLLPRTLEHALAYLEALPTTEIGASASLEQLRARLSCSLPNTPTDAAEVVENLVRDVEGGLNHNAAGRFFGWVMGGTVPAALAADWLTSTWDQCGAMYAVAPAAAVVEEVCGAWLLELLQLPATASFALVTGCQMAHVTCLAAARNAVLATRGWDVEEQGLVGAPPVRVVTGEQRHGTVERALRLLGLGRACLVDLPQTSEQNSSRPGQLTVETLEHGLSELRCRQPEAALIVLLQAGDVNTGGFDDFEALIPVARRHGAWVHVDGAFGLWAAVSPAHCHWVRGVNAADSWATDGHKWLNVPYDCGYAIVADQNAHFRSFSHRASYLNYTEDARDPMDWNPEHSKRARGFCTYAAIASLGREGIARLVEDSCSHAAALVEKIGALPGARVVRKSVINQGLVRFEDPSASASSADHDRRTEALVEAVNSGGEAFFTCTTWSGNRCMRVSVSGWNTTAEDVERAVFSVERCLRELEARQSLEPM